MLKKLVDKLPPDKRDMAMVAGGMLSLMGGNKIAALTMFGKGLWNMEMAWRERHPEFSGGLRERWRAAIELYELTHQHPTNRLLHIVGIPMIVTGAGGLLLFPRLTPPWLVAWLSWTTGWTLNFVGHGVFERNAPAFAEDPLSFVAGPIWDVLRVREIALRRPPEIARSA